MAVLDCMPKAKQHGDGVTVPRSVRRVQLVVTPYRPESKPGPKPETVAPGTYMGDMLRRQAAAHKWKPGQSGNPSGKAKGEKAMTKAYMVILQDRCTLEGYEHLTWAQAIAFGQVTSAAEGVVGAAEHLANRTEGRVPETMNLVGKIDYNAGKTAKQMLLSKLGRKAKQP